MKTQHALLTMTRVTAKTKPPYLARFSRADLAEHPLILFIPAVEHRPGSRPFARAIIVRGIPNSEYYSTGMTVCVDNFTAIERLDIRPNSQIKKH